MALWMPSWRDHKHGGWTLYLRRLKTNQTNFNQNNIDAPYTRSRLDAFAVTPARVNEHATPSPVTACTAQDVENLFHRNAALTRQMQGTVPDQPI